MHYTSENSEKNISKTFSKYSETYTLLTVIMSCLFWRGLITLTAHQFVRGLIYIEIRCISCCFLWHLGKTVHGRRERRGIAWHQCQQDASKILLHGYNSLLICEAGICIRMILSECRPHTCIADCGNFG